MQVSYQYKLRPKQSQSQMMDSWLDMQRSLYNWFLADRIDGYYQTFIMGGYCDIRTKSEQYPLTCSLSKNSNLHNPWKNPDKNGVVKKRSVSLMQDAYLAEMKQARPWYKAIHSNVLQIRVSVLTRQWKDFLNMVVVFLRSRTGLTSVLSNTSQVTLSSMGIKYICHQ